MQSAVLMGCVDEAGPRLYYPKTTDAQLAVVWIILVQPFLFGCIGIELDFRVIKGSLVPKTIIILAIGAFSTQYSKIYTLSNVLSTPFHLWPLVHCWSWTCSIVCTTLILMADGAHSTTT